LVVDTNGYFPYDAAYTGVGAARLLETRPGLSTVDGVSNGIGQRGAGSTTELVVAGRGGVPLSAVGSVLNLTAVSPRANGYVTVWPCGLPRPTTSNLNYRAGVTVGMSVVVPPGVGGKVCLFTSAATDLVVDTNGYFYR
jgi:hypothetical protein